MTAVMVVLMDIGAQDWMADYFAEVPAIIAEYGGRPFAAGRSVSVLEGQGAAPDRMAVISFESLTDREVKTAFMAHAGRLVSLLQGGARWEGRKPAVAWVHRHPVTPGETEVAANPRARSAKLRVVRRLTLEEEMRLAA